MRDWRGEVRRRVAAARLVPADEAEVVEELGQHLEDRYAELLAGGADEGAAAAAVREELRSGEPLAWALEAVRARAVEPVPPGAYRGGGGLLGGWWRDLRQGLRVLRAEPAYTVTAVLTLGLGTGAATAVFSLLHAVVLAPLPYADPGRLVTLWETNRPQDLDREPVSPVNLMDYRRLEGVFADVAAWWRPEVNLVDEAGEPIQVPTVEASENLFALLGVQPVLGRGFPRDDTLHGSESEAVISHRLWRSRYGADPRVLGRGLELNGFPYTIVGVMPAGFHFPGETDVWQRLGWDLELHSRAAHFMEAVGRLRPGVSPDRADRELAALGERLAEEAPATNGGWAARVVPLGHDVAGVFRPGLVALFGASAVLLLIACINVASLGLARSAARRSEVAVRMALGADRLRLLRQFLVESALVAGLGAALGLGLAVAGVRGLLAWSPVAIPRAGEVELDAAVLLFAVGTAAVTALLSGAAPALLASRRGMRQALEEAGRGGGTGRRAQRLRGSLVVSEVALTVALLAGAGLLMRSVATMLAVDTGVEAGDALTIDFQLPDAHYDWDRVEPFYTRLLAALRERPQVERAGAANFLPVDPGWRVPFAVAGEPTPRPGEERMAQIHSVDEGWFEALGVPLLGGRGFTPGDHAGAPAVVLVNEALARRTWPEREAVGRRIVTGARTIGPLGRRLVEGDEHRVVGVVADVRNTTLGDPAEPALYFALRQFPFRKMHLVVRGEGDAAALVHAVREEARRLDPALALGRVDELDHYLHAAADPSRVVMLLMAVFALVSLALAVIGIYGLLAYSLAQRRREIGIRMALGARRRDVVSMVVRQGLLVCLPGVVLGVGATLVGSRLLAGLLHGVRPADPVTLIAVCGLVVAVSVVAGLVPGRRAATSDPVGHLRAE
jgi:predicted permease